MEKIYVIYWSQTGNTQAMAEAIGKGITDAGKETEMEPFVAEVEGFAAGKTIALFGSYGWGDGEWMRDWTARMTGSGATVLNGEGLICQEMPDDAVLAECETLGRQLAAL